MDLQLNTLLPYGGTHERPFVSWINRSVLFAFPWAALCTRWVAGGQVMNPLYWITGIVAMGLLLYLVLALVKPEWFG
ncbi:MAG: potassium-transporting ATPase subunit F [Anaerolineales bacterium]|nr:potassium-transporting ATPase subunit F [Anaerolineales bacterium]